MPSYNITDNTTNETTEVWFQTWRLLQDHLEANPNLTQGLSNPPEFIGMHGSTLSRTSDGWKDHLGQIKKNSGRANTIRT